MFQIGGKKSAKRSAKRSAKKSAKRSAKRSASRSSKKSGGAKKSAKRSAKRSGKKRGLNAYMKFVIATRQSVVKAHPNAKVTEIAKKLGSMWRKMSNAEKAKYK